MYIPLSLNCKLAIVSERRLEERAWELIGLNVFESNGLKNQSMLLSVTEGKSLVIVKAIVIGLLSIPITLLETTGNTEGDTVWKKNT